MQKTWGTIIEEARNEIWPFPGENKNQKAPHTKYFHLAAMDLQHWIPELQVNNATIERFCSTYFNCGLTVFDAPIGLVKRVYTIANNDWCDRVDYEGAEYCEVQCWARNLLTFDVPSFDGMRSLPMGFRDADASSDSTCGRARIGIWARHNHRLYIAPWIQSNEAVVVEWDGIKKTWLETDLLNTELWDDRVIEAIKMFVRWYHEKDFGCDVEKKLSLERDFGNAKADLIHYFAEITKERGAENCCEPRLPTSAEVADDAQPTDPIPLVIGAVGDYAAAAGDEVNTGDDEVAPEDGIEIRDEVAALVDSWNPVKFIGLGDLWYGNLLTLADLLSRTPEEYQQFVTDGKYLPVLGNHDRDPVGRLSVITSYFTFPKIKTASGDIPSPGYYSVPIDSRIEVFVIDTGYDNSQVNQQADGVTETSKQAAWLRVALARSTAKFKIVCGHHTPYTSLHTVATGPTLSSDGFLAYPEIRWPLAEWGAHAYLCGHIHAYERLEVNGFPYLIVGSGGREAKTFSEPYSSFSKYRYGGFGALKITVACDSLLLEFYNRTGEKLDSLEITA